VSQPHPGGGSLTGISCPSVSLCVAVTNAGNDGYVLVGQPGISGGGGAASPRHTCVVPHLAGKTLTAAKHRLKAAHCRLGKVKRAHAARKRRGRVLSQSPAPGTHHAAGTRVTVVVGR
jgi:hypothetical protein